MAELTDFQAAVYGIIADACHAGVASPTHKEIGLRLGEIGRGHRFGNIAWAVETLANLGAIGREGIFNQTPVYVLPESGERTTKRPRTMTELHKANLREANDKRLQDMAGWPVPTKRSAAVYDKNMKLGAPVRIVGRPDDQRSAAKSIRAAATHSECGCSAELAVV